MGALCGGAPGRKHNADPTGATAAARTYLRASHWEMTAWLTRASCPTCTWLSLLDFIIRATRITMSASSSSSSMGGGCLAFFFAFSFPAPGGRAGLSFDLALEDFLAGLPCFGDGIPSGWLCVAVAVMRVLAVTAPARVDREQRRQTFLRWI